MANQKISLVTVKGLSTGDVYSDVDVTSKAVREVITNANAIRQSIRNILSFSPRERVLYPEFGNRAKDFVFEKITETVIENLRTAVRGMLEDEPRIEVTDVTVKPNINANELHVSISYNIPSLSHSDSISLIVKGGIA